MRCICCVAFALDDENGSGCVGCVFSDLPFKNSITSYTHKHTETKHPNFTKLRECERCVRVCTLREHTISDERTIAKNFKWPITCARQRLKKDLCLCVRVCECVCMSMAAWVGCLLKNSQRRCRRVQYRVHFQTTCRRPPSPSRASERHQLLTEVVCIDMCAKWNYRFQFVCNPCAFVSSSKILFSVESHFNLCLIYRSCISNFVRSLCCEYVCILPDRISHTYCIVISSLAFRLRKTITHTQAHVRMWMQERRGSTSSSSLFRCCAPHTCTQKTCEFRKWPLNAHARDTWRRHNTLRRGPAFSC